MKDALLRTLNTAIFFALIFSFMPAVAQNILFEEGFETGTLDPERWTANPAEDGGLVEPVRQITDVPDIPRTGDYALAMGRSIDGRDATTNTLDLHLNLLGQEDVTLEFWLRSEYDETHEEDAIFLSVDGGENFRKVLNLRPGDWGSLTYGLMVLDISAAAAFEGLKLSDQTVVRFQQSGTRDFVGNIHNADGFFIDDVVVKGAPEYASLPFTEGFEADMLGPSWRLADPYNSDLTAPEAEAQWGFIMPARRIKDVPEIPRTGEYALAMGRASDAREQGANAIDLHLNLSGQEDVTLSFWLRSQFDNTDEDDAIFLSDDGGKTFTEAFQIDPGSREQGVYEEITLDLDALANELGLDFTNRFVLRFQQSGTRDFVGNIHNADGFFIDDLIVTGGASFSLIEAQTFSISENVAAGTTVASLPATDAEGNSLSYELLSQSLEGAFAVSSTGEITVADADQLDFATNPVLTLEVEASDGDRTSSAMITINVTEQGEGNVNTAPAMEAQSFSIAENSEAGTVVGTITASDAEGDAISYSITAGNTDETFSIDEESGELVVLNAAALDFETAPLFTLTVAATDGALSSDATITIELTDIEDETPTSVADELRDAFLLYPNPVNDYLQLEIPEKMQGGILTIFTLKGEKLQEQSLENKEVRLNMSRVPAGNYLIRMQKEDKEFNFKIIKK